MFYSIVMNRNLDTAKEYGSKGFNRIKKYTCPLTRMGKCTLIRNRLQLGS